MQTDRCTYTLPLCTPAWSPQPPSQWLQVYAVIKATLERLALVGVINVDVQEQALMLTRTVGEEISVMIANQRSLESEFQRLIAAQHVLRHENNRLRKEVCTGIFMRIFVRVCTYQYQVC